MKDGEIAARLRAWGLHPSKSLGQNFLTDPVILERIVAAAGLTAADTVLEVGAGLGTLTTRLARRAGRVIAVELDDRLIPALEDELADYPNVTLVVGDILTLDLAQLVGPGACYDVVANLPYYITSAMLRRFLEAAPRPRRMVLTVQREVAERILARSGRMSLLAVSVQFYARPRWLFRIKPGSFYPSPQVESAVIRLDVYDTPPITVDDEQLFFRVVRAGFAQPRKQLRNTLSAGLHLSARDVAARLEATGISPRRRAETLSLAEWGRVVEALASLISSASLSST